MSKCAQRGEARARVRACVRALMTRAHSVPHRRSAAGFAIRSIRTLSAHLPKRRRGHRPAQCHGGGLRPAGRRSVSAFVGFQDRRTIKVIEDVHECAVLHLFWTDENKLLTGACPCPCLYGHDCAGAARRRARRAVCKQTNKDQTLGVPWQTVRG